MNSRLCHRRNGSTLKSVLASILINPQQTLTNRSTAQQRRHLQLERRPHRHKPRLAILRRLLQSQDKLPPQLPLHPSLLPIQPSPLPPQHLRRRETLHLHPPRPRRRRNVRRKCRGTMVTSPTRRIDPPIHHLPPRRRRMLLPRQRRRRRHAAQETGNLQKEG